MSLPQAPPSYKQKYGNIKVSLIIATYNWKEALQLGLKTAVKQTRMLHEIVVADDGSRADTAEVIREMRRQSPIPILHAWQPNEGFRAAKSRNNAIAASSGDYLIFLDGDCFVNEYFVEDHLSVANERQYIVGTRVNITLRRQRYIFATENTHISFFSWGTRKKLNAVRSPFLARLCRSTGGMASANFSVWREDIYRVNGFNELFIGNGGEDGELADRLDHAGVSRKKMRYLGMAYHLDHPLHSRRDNEATKELINETKRNKATWCEKGLDGHHKDRF